MGPVGSGAWPCRIASPTWAPSNCCSPSSGWAAWAGGGRARRHPARRQRPHPLDGAAGGVALLERSPRGSRPTEAGALVAEWARQVIAAAEALDAGLGALRERRDGRLRVVASLTVAEYLMPGWLVTLKTVRPGVAVTLRTANSTVVAEEVRGGDADLGFVEGARTRRA